MIAVSSLRWARRHKREFAGVITIEDPVIGRRRVDSLRFHREPAPAHLVLSFYDLDYALPAPYHQPWMRMAERDDIVSGLAFAKQHESLLVHCHAGVSRSTGLALAILTAQMQDPQAALEALLRLRPEAVPNRRVVLLADQVLGCDGGLLDVLDVWERSAHLNAGRRLLGRIAHFYEFGVPISASHERGDFETL